MLYSIITYHTILRLVVSFCSAGTALFFYLCFSKFRSAYVITAFEVTTVCMCSRRHVTCCVASYASCTWQNVFAHNCKGEHEKSLKQHRVWMNWVSCSLSSFALSVCIELNLKWISFVWVAHPDKECLFALFCHTVAPHLGLFLKGELLKRDWFTYFLLFVFLFRCILFKKNKSKQVLGCWQFYLPCCRLCVWRYGLVGCGGDWGWPPFHQAGPQRCGVTGAENAGAGHGDTGTGPWGHSAQIQSQSWFVSAWTLIPHQLHRLTYVWMWMYLF